MKNYLNNLPVWIQTVNWRFWGLWTVMTMFAWLTGYGAMSRILNYSLLNKVGLSSQQTIKMIIVGAVCGFIIGLVQWLALRLFSGTEGWILWNTLGGAGGMLLWNLLPFENAIGVLLYGGVIGITQSFGV